MGVLEFECKSGKNNSTFKILILCRSKREFVMQLTF